MGRHTAGQWQTIPDPSKIECFESLPDVPSRVAGTWYILPDKTLRYWNGLCVRSQLYLESKRMNGRGRKRTAAQARVEQQNRIKRVYRISIREYETLFENGCHICTKALLPYSKDACVDHHPDTGFQSRVDTRDMRVMVNTGVPPIVRGGLCSRCNSLMGAIDNDHHRLGVVDDTDWLTKAVEYKKRANFHPGTP